MKRMTSRPIDKQVDKVVNGLPTVKITKHGNHLAKVRKTRQRRVKLPDFEKNLKGSSRAIGNKMLKELYDSVS